MSVEKWLEKLPAGFMTILLLGLGVIAYFVMPVRMLPHVSPHSYLIELKSPGLTPEEFDVVIASELEQGLLALPCRDRLVSQVQASFAQFRFVIKDGCQEDRDDLKNRILEVLNARKGSWPVFTELTQSKFLYDENRWEYLIEGADPSDAAIRPWLKRLIADIRSVDGVKEVESDLPDPSLNIDLDPEAMKRLGLDGSSITELLRRHLRSSIWGAASKSGHNFNFTLRAPIREDVQGIGEIVLRTEPQTIQLKDIARIGLRQPFEEVKTRYNGKPGIFLYVTETGGANVLKLKSELEARIGKHIANYPRPLSSKLLFDNGRFMDEQLMSIRDNALIGMISMLVFIGLVMGFRAAFAQLFSTPVIVASTLIVMALTGQTLNLISVMGMFIVLGIMVDDSVIVSDTYNQLRRKGYPPGEAVSETARSLLLPLITTFVAISASLLPVFFWSSNIGEYMKPIAIIFIAALGLSLVECLTLLPAHLRKLDRAQAEGPREKAWTLIERSYRGFLGSLLRFRWVYVPVFLLATLGGALFAFQNLKFITNIGYTGERLHFNYELAGLKHEDLQSVLKELPGTVLATIHKSGVAERDGKKFYGSAYGQISLVILASSENIVRTRKDLSELILKRFAQQKGLVWYEAEKVNLVKKSEDILQTPLYIAGARMDHMLAAKDRLETKLRSLPGFITVEQPAEHHAEHWFFAPNYTRLSQAGMTTQDLSGQAAFELASQFMGRVPLAGELIDVKLSSQGYDQLSPDALRQRIGRLQVQHPIHHGSIMLDDLGKWSKEASQARIIKRDGIPSIRLNAEFDQSKVNSQEVFEALRHVTSEIRKDQPEIEINTSEAQENQSKVLQSYIAELGFASVLIYVLVALISGSYARPLILILCLLPIVAVVILSLYFHDRAISVLIFVGLLSVFGISMNDGLVILFKLKETERSMPTHQAILEAMATKLRAVLITGSCAGISLLPIAYSTEDINIFVRPIAFGAMWGLFAAMLQSLVLLPSLLKGESDVQIFASYCKQKILEAVMRKRKQRPLIEPFSEESLTADSRV